MPIAHHALVPGPGRPLRSLLSVALPVAVAAGLVCLALIDIASVRAWRGEPEDGVLWQSVNGQLIAGEVAKLGAGERAGIRPGDVLLTVDTQEVRSRDDVESAVRSAGVGAAKTYVIERQSTQNLLQLTVQPMPLTASSH
jgi:S1-C subfamily serine protease